MIAGMPGRTRKGFIGLALGLAVLLSHAATGQTLTSLYVFTGGADGAHPRYGALVRDAQGNLYGTTEDGGAYGYGVVFEVSAPGTERVLYSFQGGGDGAYPISGLIQDAAGTFYGTTFEGGAYGRGTVFQLSVNGVETLLYSFGGTTDDGAYPGTPLAMDSAGNLYGATSEGGATNNGTIFKVDVTGQAHTLYSFRGGTDGSFPSYGALTPDHAGNVLGLTIEGGTYGYGTIYKVNAKGLETVLYSFTGGADGGHPLGGLLSGEKGSLDGTTWLGGQFGGGTVFEFNTTTGKILYTPTLGGPTASLTRGANGTLYGTTQGAGADSFGTIFQLNRAEQEEVLYSFTGLSDGGFPCAPLIADPSGNLYGTTENFGGGVNYYNFGVVFEFTP